MHSLSYAAILLEKFGAKFVIYQHMVAGTQITDDFDVLNWFQIKQIQFPMLTRFSYIIQSITPLQTQNERDFSLAGIYTSSRRSNLSEEMLYDLLFININISDLGRNTIIYVFGGSLDAVADIVDETESNPDSFEDNSDNE